MATITSGKLSELFEDFLKTVTDRSGEPLYRARISQLIASEGKSLVVDFGDLLRYNDDLANKVLLEPDSSLEAFKRAAYETMRSENALYADRIRRELRVRIRGIPDQVPLRKVDTSYLDRMIAVAGMVVRTSELRPLMVEGAFVCPSGHVTYQQQDDIVLKKPPRCELCGDTRNFELDKRGSRFIDFQIIRIQELPEELPPGQLPQFFDVNVEGDIVNTARPGDRVVLTGIVRAVPEYSVGQVKTRLFRSQIDCNYAEIRGKEPEQIQITKEDEAVIRSIANSPDAYAKLVNSIAPAIMGHLAEKEAILLLLAGGASTTLPDGTKLRGDINVLFVGDPGCLVADERVVLADGSIAKIGELGREHLQSLDVWVQTGGGAGKARATRYHVYNDQPVLEVVTETGKSIKGTHNHPLLVVSEEDGKQVKKWKRLDQIRVGDRVATVTYIPCTINEGAETGFSLVRRKGRRFGGRLPRTVNDDLAAICGYTIGRGRVEEKRIVLEVEGQGRELLERLVLKVRTLFELEPRVGRRGGERGEEGYEVRVNSAEVASNLNFLRAKRVPEMILRSGNDCVASFLRWLYEARGFVRSEERGVELRADEVELLRDVQVLLLRFGVRSRIEGTSLLVNQESDIARFAGSVGFVSEGKKRELRRIASGVRIEPPVCLEESERIVSIVEHGPSDVYDIEVPGAHRFIANGVISHNTAKSEMLKFTAQVAPRGIFASGRGTTAAGLSAAVIREKNVLMLEAGVVVLADQGIACVHPDTRVLLDGKEVRVGEVAERLGFAPVLAKNGWSEVAELSGLTVSLDLQSRQVREGRVTRVRRRWHRGELLRLKLKSGNELRVTPDHLLLDGVTFEWRKASRFRTGERLVGAQACLGDVRRGGDTQDFTELGDHRTTVWENALRGAEVYEDRSESGKVSVALEVFKNRPRVSGPGEGIARTGCLLDEITGIESEEYEGYVYDLMMPEVHSYVTDGIFSHNCIDEFDKMRPEDRSALHEQMEQQSVTVAKGGIYAALNARTAILAATNPILGKYNPFQNLTDNISLPIPLLTRFDLIFVIKDQPAPAEDEKLASHILSVHARRGYTAPPPVEFSLLKKYIAYAKKIQPNLTKEAIDRIREYYLDLRRRGQEGQITATPRTLESLIRLATARAKILLREEVTEEDALSAISLMNKMVEDVLTDAATKTKADFGILLGRPAGERKNLAAAIEIFKLLEGAEKKPVEKKTFKDELIKAKFTDEDAEKMIKTMFREGLIYETKPGFFRRVGS